MSKSARGIIFISNGHVTWYFYEQAFASAGAALAEWNIDKLYTLAILVTDNKTNLAVESNWPHEVYDLHTLQLIVKRDRLEVERKKEVGYNG